MHEVTSYQLSPPSSRQMKEPELPPRRRLPSPVSAFMHRHEGTMNSRGDDWVDVDRSDGEHDVADSGGAVVLTR